MFFWFFRRPAPGFHTWQTSALRVSIATADRGDPTPSVAGHGRGSQGLAAAALLPLLLAVAIAGCTPTDPSPVSTDEPESTDPSTARPLCIVASGDTHGWIIPCGCTSSQSGGLLRRGTYIQEQRKAADVVVVDVGGAADGTAPYQRARFRAILDGEQAMKLAVHNLGAAEVAFGPDVLRELQQETGVRFVSANARQSDGTPIAAPWHLVSENQSAPRLLLTGVLSPDFATSDILVTEPADAILGVLKNVNQDYDRLIVLAYLPIDQLRSLAETLPEADVIIGGPTGQALSPERIGQTLVLSATNKGKFLAEVTYAPGDGPPSGRIVEMSPVFPDDEQQTENLTAFRQFLEERDFEAGESGFADRTRLAAVGHQQIAGTESCRDCHAETHTHWAGTGHAEAWQRLLHEGAHVDPYCQQCHTTGYGLTGGFVSVRQSADRTQTGCESCHGPSSAHVADSAVRTPFDARGICLKCHDPENSPHFEFDSYWEQVRHE
ncbi:MAG: multiheme c-type cytochrome [Fuerstiella sp.]